MNKFFLFITLMFNFLNINMHAYSNADNLTPEQENLIYHVTKSFAKAEEFKSKLNSKILQIEGMSSAKVRHFLNNLCSLDGAAYLEIGSWKGSTLISALYGNENKLIDAVAIDNWSEFAGPKKQFLANLQQYLPNSRVRFFEEDCFSLNKSEVFKKPVKIYFYDGEHSYSSQKQAFTYFDSILDHNFIAIVDDWNWPDVRKGTYDAFRELGYLVLFELPLFSTCNYGSINEWWNGLYIAVIQKKVL